MNFANDCDFCFLCVKVIELNSLKDKKKIKHMSVSHSEDTF